MVSRMRQLVVAGAMVAVVLAVSVGSVTVSAAVADRAFTAIGCDVGDYTCYYAKMGGGSTANTYYCRTGYYECTNGVPISNIYPTADNGVQACAGGATYTQNGAYGCLYGNPIGVAVPGTPYSTAADGTSGSYPNVIVAGNIAAAGLGATNTTGAARHP